MTTSDAAASGGTAAAGARVGRPARLADVAARAGVSVGLASRILRDDATVRAQDATQERVRAAARDLQYTPNEIGRALRSRVAGAIGLVVHDVGNPIYAEIIHGVQQAALERGVGVFLYDADAIGQDDRALRALLTPGRVDGLLVQAGGYETDQDLMRRLVGRLPVVLVNNLPMLGAPAVHLDDAGAARIATRHLLELGHTRLAYVGGRATSLTSQLRREAFEGELTQRGLTPVPAVESGWDMDAGRVVLTTLRRRRAPLVTGLVVANTLVAAGVVVEARRVGIQVPEQLSVVSLHDVWLAKATSPALTVVRTPLAKMGARAVEVLLGHEQGHPLVSEQVVLPRARLVVRASTARVESHRSTA